MKNRLTDLLGFRNGEKQRRRDEQEDFEEEQVSIEEIPIEELSPNPYQPRVDFDEVKLKELAESIKNHGIIQPLTVRKKKEGYEIIAGERRLRASKLINLEKVPAIVKEFGEKETAEIALIENLQRKDLGFLEEAAGYQKLLSNFDVTQKDLAEQIGKSQSTIANKLRLLKLPEEVQQLAKHPNVSERHARALLKLPNEELQTKVIKEAIEEEYTVRETEDLIEEIMNELNNKDDSEDEIKIIKCFNDVRLSLNTIRKTIDDIKDSGLEIEAEEIEQEDYIEVNIRLPKNK
ncbi:nucleoid occlusion protein [Fuchsiella alkaliacetigena]|uniref:nucleoid occlusion protein n=1 Tax=Fuchsiella alkaliacetigena TaxID=957042 RepID=UPI00200A6802|nr:nucleoid occlusion protein [Fuchsiella alkaliacetigena]MCK8824536.1 nucleoid occlusion protein [Fuchsiella alkaliacetigena]